MKNLLATIAVFAIAATALPAQAKKSPKRVRVVSTLGVLGAIASEIGGDAVAVKVLASPNRDPHKLVAKPTYKVAAKNADLFIELGLGLDGWAKAVTDASGNPTIQPGQPGRIVASTGVRTRELPATLSKAWGDIHPYGNPHIWLDPVNMKQIARNITAGLVAVDREREQLYQQRLEAFERRIDVALYGDKLLAEYGASKLERLSSRGRLISYLKRKGSYGMLGGWLSKAERLQGLKIVAYHKSWIYFCDRFGLEIVAELEEKPGIPPSQGYLHQVIQRVKSEGVRILFIDVFYPTKDGNYVATKTGATIISSPIDVEGTHGADSYFALIDNLLTQLLAAAG